MPPFAVRTGDQDVHPAGESRVRYGYVVPARPWAGRYTDSTQTPQHPVLWTADSVARIVYNVPSGADLGQFLYTGDAIREPKGHYGRLGFQVRTPRAVIMQGGPSFGIATGEVGVYANLMADNADLWDRYGVMTWATSLSGDAVSIFCPWAGADVLSVQIGSRSTPPHDLPYPSVDPMQWVGGEVYYVVQCPGFYSRDPAEIAVAYGQDNVMDHQIAQWQRAFSGYAKVKVVPILWHLIDDLAPANQQFADQDFSDARNFGGQYAGALTSFGWESLRTPGSVHSSIADGFAAGPDSDVVAFANGLISDIKDFFGIAN